MKGALQNHKSYHKVFRRGAQHLKCLTDTSLVLFSEHDKLEILFLVNKFLKSSRFISLRSVRNLLV